MNKIQINNLKISPLFIVLPYDTIKLINYIKRMKRNIYCLNCLDLEEYYMEFLKLLHCIFININKEDTTIEYNLKKYFHY